MSASRFQNIPKTMVLKNQDSAHCKNVNLVTDRSFKLEQFHFDVAGIVLQPSDHTLQDTTQIQYLRKIAK
jgi:hypothetical protein